MTLDIGSITQLVGMALFFGGVAVGMLLVFTDRHRYSRPLTPKYVGTVIVLGLVLWGSGWVVSSFVR